MNKMCIKMKFTVNLFSWGDLRRATIEVPLLCMFNQKMLCSFLQYLSLIQLNYTHHVRRTEADPWFPRGYQLPSGVRQPIILQKFCRNLHENE